MFQYKAAVQCIAIVLKNSRRLIFLLALVYGASCDSVPGPLPGVSEQTPIIETFSISPQRVDYSLLNESVIDGDSVHLVLDFEVTIQTRGTTISQVIYAVLDPELFGDPIKTGTLISTGNNVYGSQVNLTLSAFDVDDYPVIVYMIDSYNRLGGEARTQLEYFRSFQAKSPPVIEKLTVPSRIQRPGPGEPARALVFIAEVSDPNGLTDIELVEFWNDDAPAVRILLCDDGNERPCGNSTESGDEEAGDGRFTRTAFIQSSNSLGPNTFTFEAVDRAGLRSKEVSHTIEVYE